MFYTDILTQKLINVFLCEKKDWKSTFLVKIRSIQSNKPALEKEANNPRLKNTTTKGFHIFLFVVVYYSSSSTKQSTKSTGKSTYQRKSVIALVDFFVVFNFREALWLRCVITIYRIAKGPLRGPTLTLRVSYLDGQKDT